jgi:uncharacterized membrane protein YhaH (DUF805 family)
MNFTDAISSGFSKYVQFQGRASRSEYWYWTLFGFLVSVAANIIDSMSGMGFVSAIAGLVLLLPGLAVCSRRLHDIDRTFWWVLLGFTIIGALVLLYWACERGTFGANRFGPDPLGEEPPSANKIAVPLQS